MNADELGGLRNGAVPPSVMTRVQALLMGLDRREARVRTPGPRLTWEQRAAALRDDLRDGRVLPFDGVAQFREQDPNDRNTAQWIFHGPAPATICFADDVFRRVLPGTWRLYGLPRSGLVLGAEPTPGAQPEQPLERYRERLLSVQKLSARDLAELRAGRTCAFVQATISRDMRLAWLFLLVGIFGGVLGAGTWIMAAMVRPEHTVDVAGVPLAWPALFLIFPLVFTPISIQRAIRLRRERSAPILRSEGTLERGWTGGAKPQQFITVAGEFFRGPDEPVVRDIYHHAIPGSLVRLYVTAHRRLVVGAEPLPVPDVPVAQATAYRS